MGSGRYLPMVCICMTFVRMYARCLNTGGAGMQSYNASGQVWVVDLTT